MMSSGSSSSFVWPWKPFLRAGGQRLTHYEYEGNQQKSHFWFKCGFQIPIGYFLKICVKNKNQHW
jgi:hypothetical protein